MSVRTNQVRFVDPEGGSTGGSDLNDGKDPFGFALTAATFTTGTLRLNETDAFIGYSFVSGDQIAITGGTGVTAGLYTIANKINDSEIELDDDIGGTDPSDVTSSDGPYATTQKILDNMLAAGEGYLMATATETISARIDLDTINGAATARIKIRGANSRGVHDGTNYTIQLVANIGTNGMLSQNGNWGHYEFHNIIFDADRDGSGTGKCVACGGSSTPLHFYDCQFNNSTNFAMTVEFTAFHHLVNCTSDNCLGGFDGLSTNDGKWKAEGCIVSNATGTSHVALRSRIAEGTITKCITHNCEQDGIGGRNECYISFNTSYNNASDGYVAETNINSAYWVGNCASDNGAFGFNFNGYAWENTAYIDWNHTHNNTSGETDLTTDNGANKMPRTHNQTGDPLFTETGAGIEDFRPTSGSPLIENGPGGVNIGAMPTAGGGGGTTILVRPRRVM